jgi:hypothetical protein
MGHRAASPSLSKPAAAKPISETAASRLAGEWAKLEAERLALGRAADDLKKRQTALERQLMPFVEANSRRALRSVTLKRFRLSIIQVAKSPYWKGQVEKLLGDEGVRQLYRDAGMRDALVIESIRAIRDEEQGVIRATKPAPKKPPATPRAKAPPARSLKSRGGQKKLGFAA